MFAGDFRHPPGPAAIAPGDQLNIGISRSHGPCKLESFAGSGFKVESIPVIGCLVSDLPVSDSKRSRAAVCTSLGISGVVAVSHPVAGLFCVAGAYLALLTDELLASVRLEIDADQRFSPDLAAEVDELGGAHLVRFDASPLAVDHCRTPVPRTDALAPAVKVAEDSAPAHHRRRQRPRHLDNIVAPLIARVIPGRFHRTVRCT